MGTHRFFLKQIDPALKEIIFSNDKAHQIQHVLRLKIGDRVTVLGDDGRAYQVQLTRMDPEAVVGRIIESGEARTDLPAHLHLYFPLSKRDKVEWILQKGTEVGVFAFHPFISQRSLVQSVEMSAKRRIRWESIIREAAEQSGRAQLPQLYSPESLASAIHIAVTAHNQVIAASVGENERTLKDALRQISSLMQRTSSVPSLGLFVGPEGGFAEHEIETLKQAGVLTVSLGAQIYRMETAAIVFPAIVMYELNAVSRSE